MATVTKNFKVKSGLVVEGTTGTINNHDILTKKQDDQDYIVGLIGGTSTSANTPDTVVKRDGSGNFAAGTITANLTGDVTGNADTASTLETARTIALAGDVTGSVSFDGSANVTITATVDGSFATDAEVTTAKSEAISTASSDATTKANAAQSAAELTASNALSSAVIDLENYADAAAAQAESDAAADATSKANAAQAAAEATAAAANTSLYGTVTSDIATAKSEAIASANGYTDSAVANLVDAAPALLDTLNELAAAIGDDANYATTVSGMISAKADTTYVNSEISSLDSAAQGYANAAQSAAEATASADATSKANAAQAAAEATASSDATTKANAAEYNAKGYADSLASNYDAAGSASNAQTAAETFATNAINALSTSDIEEGTNQYFTSNRAKIAAANLITSATKTNIVITGDENGLTITAENGVADSSTSDLAEGSNLYFTDARAVSALEAVTPDFPAIEIASVAKQVAASATVATASENTAVSWAKANYRSAEFLVKVANGTHTEVSKVILTLDTSDNIAITEYAMVGTNGSLGSVSADVSGTDVRLRVTTNNNNSDVTVVGTLLA